jgi:hypothetical protein
MKPMNRLSLLALGLALAATAAQAQLKPKAAGPGLGAPATAPAAPAGAIADPAMEKSGQVAAQAWLLLLDRHDWGTAWDTASTVFRQKVPLPTWMDAVPKVREPLGRFVERRPVQVVYKKTLAGRPDGDYVTAVFASRFEKKSDAQETVTVERESDGRWHVTGYEVR